MTFIQKARTTARLAVEALPVGDKVVESFRRALRVRGARAFVEAGRMFTGAPNDPDMREAIVADFEAVCMFTQLSIAGICNLEAIARDVIVRRVHGAFVECGTWRGGALGYWARSYIRNGGIPARSAIFGFDSFEGMPQMTENDGETGARWLYGKSMAEAAPDAIRGSLTSTGANVASEADCWAMLTTAGFPKDRCHVVRGWFQDTLPLHKNQIGPIAVLRLDGDWYESTRCCLSALYDQVVVGGVVIVDDYGAFPGCKRAVDEFLSEQGVAPHLVYVDSSVRFFRKP
jgi:hypothetical protein